jgi:dynamin-binding protein
MSPASLDREPIAPMAKRKYALLELLSSERVYANDLALMRHIHIPMALGHSSHFHPPDSPSAEVDGLPSTRSTSSRSALSSSTPFIFKDEVVNKPPMTAEDVRVIFSNTEDLAVFADVFAERIEVALGDTLDVTDDGSPGISDPDSRVDAVGELFLEVVGPVPISSLTITSLITSKLGPGIETAVHNIHYSASIGIVTFNYAYRLGPRS